MKPQPNTASLQQRLGPVVRVIIAGEVLAVTASARRKGRHAPWTLLISGDAGPYSLIVADDAGIRVAERLKVGDFVVAEATLIPKGARCEIKSLLIQSNRETRLPVVPVRADDVVDEVETDDEDAGCEGLPWEDTGS